MQGDYINDTECQNICHLHNYVFINVKLWFSVFYYVMMSVSQTT